MPWKGEFQGRIGNSAELSEGAYMLILQLTVKDVFVRVIRQGQVLEGQWMDEPLFAVSIDAICLDRTHKLGGRLPPPSSSFGRPSRLGCDSALRLLLHPDAEVQRPSKS